MLQLEPCAVTTDFWTSASTEGYVTITCHNLVSSWELKSCVLATYQVKMRHTAENIAAELKKVANDWNITNKISCIVTDNVANMTAAAQLTGWVHVPCFAHTLNLIVQEAIDRDQGLTDVCTKARSIVTYFFKSWRAYLYEEKQNQIPQCGYDSFLKQRDNNFLLLTADKRRFII